MPRVLLDTNVLIAAAYNPHSASSRIVNMVERDELKMIVSPAIEREYERLIPKAVRTNEKREWVWRIIQLAESVTPQDNPPVTEDREDDKFLAAALAGKAEAIISNDQHLLAVHPYQGIDILQPKRFLEHFLEGDNPAD